MRLGSNSAYDEQRRRMENNPQQKQQIAQPDANTTQRKVVTPISKREFAEKRKSQMSNILPAVEVVGEYKKAGMPIRQRQSGDVVKTEQYPNMLQETIVTAQKPVQKQTPQQSSSQPVNSGQETLYSYLQSIGVNPNDLKARQQLASNAGMSNYNRTASQNIQLLKALKEQRAIEAAELANANERAERAARLINTPTKLQPQTIQPVKTPTRFGL